MPGRKPCLQCLPASVEAAKPMLVAPPLKKRPTWKVETIVLPKANVSGSISVLWTLSGLAYGSVLIRTRLAADAGRDVPRASRIAAVTVKRARTCRRGRIVVPPRRWAVRAPAGPERLTPLGGRAGRRSQDPKRRDYGIGDGLNSPKD